jgi:hypothetical protein
MTISSQTRQAGPYVGNDLATAFAFAFKVFSAADLQVVRTYPSGVESTLTLNTDYTVLLNSNQDSNPGGTITLPAALASGYKITITSNVTPLQATDLTNQGGFYPKVITNALDKLTILIQQMLNGLGRSLKFPISESLAGVTLPPVNQRANQYVAFDSSGNVIVRPGSVVFNSNDAAVVGFLQSGSGAVARDVQTKIRESVSIKDFGAAGDGITNDTAAFENFVTYCAQYGATGFIPAGTYLIDPSTRTFSGNKPFVIRGEGRGATILKNRNTAASFIYWTGPNGVAFENLKIDGAFTGLPSTPVSGGTLVLVNSNDNTVRGVDFVNIWRVALMIYNDHQTTTTNIYGGHTIDNCRVYGPSNYSGNVGPSAFLIADVVNSKITKCYISQIGLYGYEFKNDCSNTLISNCVAEDTYYPLYYGGDGAHTELGYVKNSLIENCTVRRATSGVAITMGLASNNTVRNISIDSTGVATPNFPIYISNGSNNNSVTGIDLKGRNYEAVTVRTGSNGNVVEFTNMNDGAYGGRGSTGIANDCANNTVIFGNRDSAQPLYLESYSFNNNNIFDRKYNLENYDASVKPLKKIRFGDVGLDALPSTSKGLALVGSDVNYYQTSAQGSTYQYFGSFAKCDIAGVRYRLTDGTKFESLYNGTATFTYVTDSIGYYPQADNTQKLGGVSNRWSTVYAGTGTINTSDARDKQDVEELTGAELRVAQSLKGLFRKFRFKDAVAEKGADARIHVGVIAQDVKEAFEREGLDGFRYAVLCWDEWTEQPEVTDEEGKVIEPHRPAGNRYGIRYDELYSFIFGALANA